LAGQSTKTLKNTFSILGHKAGTLKKLIDLTVLMRPNILANYVAKRDTSEYLLLYARKHKLVGVFYQNEYESSYNIRHGFTLYGHFGPFRGITQGGFLSYLVACRSPCLSGEVGSWNIYTISGKLDATIEHFCPLRPCIDDEGEKSAALNTFFDHLNSNQGTIIVKFYTKLNVYKQCIIVTYRFNKIRGRLKHTRLEILIRYPLVAGKRKQCFVRPFAIPNAPEIFVHVDIRTGGVIDHRLYLLSKSKGFKNEEIPNEAFMSELKTMGSRTFDNVMNRMIFMSRSLRKNNPIVKAIHLDCDGHINFTNQKVTHVKKFKTLKYFLADLRGSVFLMDFDQSAGIYSLVPEIH
jgi:hypothetical protein